MNKRDKLNDSDVKMDEDWTFFHSLLSLPAVAIATYIEYCVIEVIEESIVKRRAYAFNSNLIYELILLVFYGMAINHFLPFNIEYIQLTLRYIQFSRELSNFT
jgi:hypothetical protein